QDGVLLCAAATTLGDTTFVDPNTLQRTAILKLKGGMLATTVANGSFVAQNPVVVDSGAGTAPVGAVSTAASASKVIRFSEHSVVGTSGSLTIANSNTDNNSATVSAARFTGQGFNCGLPIVVSSTVNVGTGAKSSQLQGGNTSGTQSFSGVISGGGVRRVNA